MFVLRILDLLQFDMMGLLKSANYGHIGSNPMQNIHNKNRSTNTW